MRALKSSTLVSAVLIMGSYNGLVNGGGNFYFVILNAAANVLQIIMVRKLGKDANPTLENI